MKPFKNILIVYPLVGQIAQLASSLRLVNHFKVTLLAVVPKIEEPVIESPDGTKIDLQKLLENDFREQLEEQKTILESMDIRCVTKTATGKTFAEVIRQVNKAGHDLVIMAADGQSTIRDQLFGSTSMHLIRKCPCQVWVVKPTRRKRYRCILAAVDPDPKHGVRDSLNSTILQRASHLAELNGAKLHVVHAWDTLGGELNRGKRWMSKAEIRLYTEQVAADHRRRLSNLLSEETNGIVQVHMIHGKAEVVVPQVAAEQKADLLVMGTICRSGIPGFFIGNTAEMVLNQVDCSVLTIKPSDFLSPVMT